MYTIPPYAPPYPPFPGRFADVTRYALVCEAPADAVAEIITPPLEPREPKSQIEVFFSKFLDTPFGPYLEAGVTVPVRYGDREGSNHAYMYLDVDDAVTHGRETYGMPKKMAGMTLEEDGDLIHAVVERRGVKLMEFNFDFSKDGDELKPLTKRIQVRVVPRVEGPGAESITVIGTRGHGGKLHSKKFGTGDVTIGRSDADPLYKLEPLKVLGAYRTHTDGGLDYGEVLARVDEKDLQG